MTETELDQQHERRMRELRVIQHEENPYFAAGRIANIFSRIAMTRFHWTYPATSQMISAVSRNPVDGIKNILVRLDQWKPCLDPADVSRIEVLREKTTRLFQKPSELDIIEIEFGRNYLA